MAEIVHLLLLKTLATSGRRFVVLDKLFDEQKATNNRLSILSFVENFYNVNTLFHFIYASCVIATPLQDYKFLNKGCT